MAVLRLERQSCMYGNKPVYDGIVEAETDLAAMAGSNKASFNGSMIQIPPGSIMYGLHDEAVHVKQADGTWT